MKGIRDILAADITVGGVGKYAGRRTSPTHDVIAQLVFSLYEARGRQDGRHVEDWLRAEQELVRHYAWRRSSDE